MCITLKNQYSTLQRENLTFTNGFNSSYATAPSEPKPKTSTKTASSLNLIPRPLLSRNSSSEKKANRLFTRQATKEKLIELYQTANLIEESLRMKTCCQKFGVLTCGSHLIKKYPTERCRLPLCPDCAVYRQKRAYRRLFPKFQDFTRQNEKDRVVMITLTVSNSSDNLLDIHREFKESFRRLRQKVNWKHHIRGGIASFELTVDKSGKWHYHAHLLCLRKSFDRYEQADLSEDWRKATRGAGFIVDIRQVHDLTEGFSEILKYSFKPLDLTKSRFNAERLRQFYELAKRSRLAETFGELYGLETSDEETEIEPELEIGSPCPACQKPLEFVFVSRVALEKFYLSSQDTKIMELSADFP